MNILIDLIKECWFMLTVFLLILIATLSLWPAEQLPQMPGGDKTHHFISYGVLILPLALRKPQHWLFIALGFAAFSGAIELIQPYVNRYGDWFDLAANIAGLICGVIVANVYLYYRQITLNNT
jgi:VanZ family protein